ncbi:Panacea domain-containing protein [Delftia sp. RIT313]|uniref:Panacea domain-containing protein n=1 Tax=Delftia sp. RIT313 TaxID=1468410 RepID=UPI0009DD6D07|nr:type II toxin-antitoxin system antitoxin SocA domain-containing protein [Delftia sp. RIT313]
MNEKSLAVAQYILSQRIQVGDQVTPMQLIKLVYIAEGIMLGRNGRSLINERVEAWEYGPVIRSVYHAVREFRSNPVSYVPGANPNYPFNHDEIEVMNAVARSYGPHDGIRLSAATHQPGTPWSQTWEGLGRNGTISTDIIENHYSRLLNGNTTGL